MKLCAPIFFVTFLMMLSCKSNKEKAKDYFIKAQNYFYKNDYGISAKLIDSARHFDSTNYDFVILIAKIKSGAKQFDEAIKILKQINAKNLKSDSINFLIAENYQNLGSYYSVEKNDSVKEKDNFEQAIHFSDLTIVNNLQFFEAYLIKAKALHNLKKYDEALITLNNAILIFSDSINLISFRGIEKFELGDSHGAIADLDKAIQSNKLDSIDLATAFRFRGRLYESKDSIENALQDFTNAINYNPKDYFAYVNRGYLYKNKNLKDKTCSDFRKAADLGYVAIYDEIKEYCEK